MATQIERPVPVSSEIALVIERYTASEYFQNRTKSDNSKAAYKADLRFFREYLRSQGVLSLAELKMDYLSGWVAQMSEHRSTATIERRISSIRTFSRWLFDNQLSKLDPDFEIPIPKDDRALTFEVLGKDRYKALVDHLRQEGELRDLVIVELLVSTGADASEVVNTNIGDIRELENGQLVARFVKPRTAERRTIVLNDRTAQALKEYLGQRKNPKKDDPLFTRKRGKFYTNERLTRQGIWLLLNCYKSVIGNPVLNQRVFTNTFADNFEGDAEGLADARGISLKAASRLFQRRRNP